MMMVMVRQRLGHACQDKEPAFFVSQLPVAREVNEVRDDAGGLRCRVTEGGKRNDKVV